MISEPKFLYSVSLLGLSSGVLISWINNSLYPGIIISLAFSLLPILILNSGRISLIPVMAHILFVSVILKYFIMAFPSSIIGIDPIRFVIWTESVAQTGSLQGIDSSFYSSAPLYLIFLHIFSRITNFSISESLLAVTILIGLFIPLFAFLYINLFNNSADLCYIFAGLVSVVPLWIFRGSYWPTAQTFSLISFLMSVYLIIHPNKKDKRLMLLLIALLVSLFYSHKVPIFILTALAISLLVTHWLAGRLDTSQDFHNDIYTYLSITVFCTTIVMLQLGYLPSLVRQVAQRTAPAIASILSDPTMLVRSIIDIFGSAGSESLSSSSPGAAHRPPSLSENIFVSHSRNTGTMVLLVFSGVSWLYLFYKLKFSKQALSLLTVCGVFGAISAFSRFSPETISINRSMLMGEPFFIVLISITLTVFISDSKLRGNLAKVMIAILILSQVFSGAALPDYDDTSRYYLQADEFAGVEHNEKFARGEVATDYLSYQHSLKFEDQSHSPFIDGEYVDRNLLSIGHEYVFYRDTINVYRIIGENSGDWILDWDPESDLNSEYNKIYSSGGGVTYQKP